MSSSQAVAGGILGGMMAVILIGLIVLWVFLIIARWKIFTKAGEAGWKSIIPIYADYIQWKIGWKKTGLFWAYLGLTVVGYVLLSMSGLTSSQLAGTAAVTASSVSNMPLLIAGCIVLVVAAVLSLLAAYKLFQSFGYGVGMFIGYIFLSFIILLVLGFGSSRYLGPQD